MKYYLERVIPILENLSKEEQHVLMSQLKPFIKEIVPQEEFSGTLILTDSPEGVDLAEKAGLPCLGLERSMGEGGEKDAAALACPYVVTDISAVTPICLEQVYRRFCGIPWEILESKRCIVREWTEEDAAQILEIYEDIEDFSLKKPFKSVEEGQKYLRDYRKMVYCLYEYGLWAVETKDSKELVGVAGLENQIFEEGEYLALGYVIGKKWREQGYAKEVCQAILDYGSEELGLELLHCFVEPENEASLHLVEKLGFYRTREVVQEAGKTGEEGKRLFHYIWENQQAHRK